MCGSKDLRSLLERNRRFTQQDLDELTQDTWTCLALGCQGCKALEMFGLCWHDLAEEILLRLLRGFSQNLGGEDKGEDERLVF